MTDRRSKTSRRNLGAHIPEALSPAGSSSIGIRLTNDLLSRLDAARGDMSRSEYVRQLLEEHLPA